MGVDWVPGTSGAKYLVPSTWYLAVTLAPWPPWPWPWVWPWPGLAWPWPPGPRRAEADLLGVRGAVAPAQGGRRRTYGLGPSGIVGSHAGGSCYIDSCEYQPIFPHGRPNHEELISKTFPKQIVWVDPPPYSRGALTFYGILVLCIGF